MRRVRSRWPVAVPRRFMLNPTAVVAARWNFDVETLLEEGGPDDTSRADTIVGRAKPTPRPPPRPAFAQAAPSTRSPSSATRAPGPGFPTSLPEFDTETPTTPPLSSDNTVVVTVGWDVEAESPSEAVFVSVIDQAELRVSLPPSEQDFTALRAFVKPYAVRAAERGRAAAKEKLDGVVQSRATKEKLVDENPAVSVVLLGVVKDANSERLASLLKPLTLTPTPGVAAADEPDTYFHWAADTDAWRLAGRLFAVRAKQLSGFTVPKNIFEAYAFLHDGDVLPYETKDGSAGAVWALVSSAVLAKAAAQFEAPPSAAVTRHGSRAAAVSAQIAAKVLPPVRLLVVNVNGSSAKSIMDRTWATVKVYDPAEHKSSEVKMTTLVDKSSLANAAKALSAPDVVTLVVATKATTSTDLQTLHGGMGPALVGPLYRVVGSHMNAFLPTGHRAIPPQTALPEEPREYWAALLQHTGLGPLTFLSAVERMGREMKRQRSAVNAVGAEKYSGRLTQQDFAGIAASLAAGNRTRATDGLTRAAAAASAEKAIINSSGKEKKGNIVELLKLDAELAEWNRKIYADSDRLRREQAQAKALERWLVIDLETTTKSAYRRKATPFLNENRVVLPGTLDYKGNMWMPKEYLKTRDDFKLPCLDDYDVIVGHNIKFDLLYMWKSPELVKFLKRGGKIWDTMYAEFLLTGQQTKLGTGAGLDAVAAQYGGKITKLDEVKEAWARGVQTYDIPIATLSKYLSGDLENTATIFRAQKSRALAQSQATIINLRMDGLLCTTEMEYNGLRVNRKLARKHLQDLSVRSATLSKELAQQVPTEIPEVYRRQWSWSGLNLVSFYYGGNIQFEPMMAYPSWRFHGVTNYASATDVRTAAELAYLTNNLSVRIMGRLVDPYLRTLGHRSNINLSEVFDEDHVTEQRYEPFFLSVQTDVPAAEQPIDPGTTGVERAPFVPLSSIERAPIRGLALYHPFKKAALVATVAAAPGELKIVKRKASYAGATDVDVTEIEGSWDDVKIALRAFVQANCTGNPRDDTANGRTAMLLSRRSGELFEPLLRSHGLDNDFFEVIETEDDGTPLSRPCRVVYGDCSCLEANVVKFHPTVAEAVRSAQYALMTGNDDGPAAPAKGKKVAKKALQMEEEDLACTRGVSPLYRALLFGERARRLSNAVRAEYDKQRKEMVDEGTLPPRKFKKGKLPKPRAVNPDGFNIKGIPVDVKLDLPFASEPAPGLATEQCQLLRLVGGLIGNDNFFVSRLEQTPKNVIEYAGKLSELVPVASEQQAIRDKFKSDLTGKNLVSEETLSLFKKKGCPTAARVLELRGMEKMLSTYYEDQSRGMMALVYDTDSCIHHELVHNKTTTGRLSSANPNCQNIPKDDSVRELFVSRFTDEKKGTFGVCIESDYAQLEVITLAVLARDRQMIQDLKEKVDFHCKRVTMMRPDLTYAEVVDKAKKQKLPEFVKLRQQAKIFSFQRQYGAGVRMLSESTGLTEDQVKSLIDAERVTYKDCDAFNALVERSAKQYVPELQDMKRTARGDVMFKGLFPTLTGSRYVFTESEVPKVMLERMAPGDKGTSFSPTHLKNYPVQGFAGEIVQIMLGRLFRFYVANDNYGGQALLTNTVHDCVWVDAMPHVAKQAADDLGRVLSQVPETLAEFFPEIPVDCEFPTDTVVGTTMGNLVHVGSFDFGTGKPKEK